MVRKLGVLIILASLGSTHCKGGERSTSGAGAGDVSSTSGEATISLNLATTVATGSGATSSGGLIVQDDGGAATLMGVIRDFRFYDPTDPTTNLDFENVPPTWPQAGAIDPDVVTDTLGTDNKPVYKMTGSNSGSTHGQASFNQWYNDVAGTNIHVDYPLPITAYPGGTYGYSSAVSGAPYDNGLTGGGFFPIDDGTPYATAFGDQAAELLAKGYPANATPHNYSFTFELHTQFTYSGGETFNFQGDDDVFVYINQALVINLGGIHGPEQASVSVDSLGLTLGQTYPLDFFSAERHIIGSNIIFTTSLQLVSTSTVK
jgi:fibro-slime domain-containing protein